MQTWHQDELERRGSQRLPDAMRLANLVRPLRICLASDADGWRVAGDGISPGDAMAALARDGSLEGLTVLCGSGERQWAACLQGPVEVRDAEAISAAVDAGTCPLAADIRMRAAIVDNGGEGVVAWARERNDVLLVAGEALRRYVGGLPGVPSCPSPPECGVMDALLDEVGAMAIRPIETEVYETFVDIGVHTGGGEGPAPRCVIYDLPSGTWHVD